MVSNVPPSWAIIGLVVVSAWYVAIGSIPIVITWGACGACIACTFWASAILFLAYANEFIT
jgi:hypothetical protein